MSKASEKKRLKSRMNAEKPPRKYNYKTGRPTKYDPKFCHEIIDFFNREVGTKTIQVEDRKTGEIHSKMVASDLPTLAEFCCMLDIDRDTLKEWANVHPDFSAAIKKAKQHQERILVANGMNGLYNTAFAIFTAKNLIHWSDRHEVTGSEGSALLPKQEIDAMDTARRIAFALANAVSLKEF